MILCCIEILKSKKMYFLIFLLGTMNHELCELIVTDEIFCSLFQHMEIVTRLKRRRKIIEQSRLNNWHIKQLLNIHILPVFSHCWIKGQLNIFEQQKIFFSWSIWSPDGSLTKIIPVPLMKILYRFYYFKKNIIAYI